MTEAPLISDGLQRTTSGQRQGTYIFQDIDGVWISRRSWQAFGNLQLFDPVAVRLTEELVRRHNADIVWCSNWRYNHPESAWQLRIYECLQRTPLVDLVLWRQILGQRCFMTPDLTGKERHEEVYAWLKENALPAPYVILDDSDMGPLNHRAVKTDQNVGLDWDDYRRADLLLTEWPTEGNWPKGELIGGECG